jgi:hypothetical protein
MATIPETAPQMTERQWKFIRNLCEERDMDPMEYHELDKRRASGAIEHLLTLPKKRSTYPVAKDGVHVEYEEIDVVRGGEDKVMRIGYIVGAGDERIPRGRYALRNSDDPNDLTFYRVWVGERGGWAVKVLAGPNEFPLKREQGVEVLKCIATDPPTSSAVYGWALGRCGICGLRLTNQISRELGMGPVCRSRVHW